MRELGNFDSFPIGTKVKIKSQWVDFYPWYGEIGRVVKNSGTYLGIRVKLSKARHFEGGYVQKDFNFNPRDLQILKTSCRCRCHKGLLGKLMGTVL